MNALILALLAVGGLILTGTVQTGLDFVDSLKVQVGFRELPSISNWNVEFPVVVTVINSTDITMPLESVFASIYKKEEGKWKFLGSSQPDMAVNIKAKDDTHIPLNFKIPFLTAGMEMIKGIELLKSLIKPQNTTYTPRTYKVEARIGVQGRTITQNFETTI